MPLVLVAHLASLDLFQQPQGVFEESPLASFDPPMASFGLSEVVGDGVVAAGGLSEIGSKGAKWAIRRRPRVFFDLVLIYSLVSSKGAKTTGQYRGEALR
jgi:hypothetical protein